MLASLLNRVKASQLPMPSLALLFVIVQLLSTLQNGVPVHVTSAVPTALLLSLSSGAVCCQELIFFLTRPAGASPRSCRRTVSRLPRLHVLALIAALSTASSFLSAKTSFAGLSSPFFVVLYPLTTAFVYHGSRQHGRSTRGLPSRLGPLLLSSAVTLIFAFVVTMRAGGLQRSTWIHMAAVVQGMRDGLLLMYAHESGHPITLRAWRGITWCTAAATLPLVLLWPPPMRPSVPQLSAYTGVAVWGGVLNALVGLLICKSQFVNWVIIVVCSRAATTVMLQPVEELLSMMTLLPLAGMLLMWRVTSSLQSKQSRHDDGSSVASLSDDEERSAGDGGDGSGAATIALTHRSASLLVTMITLLLLPSTALFLSASLTKARLVHGQQLRLPDLYLAGGVSIEAAGAAALCTGGIARMESLPDSAGARQRELQRLKKTLGSVDVWDKVPLGWQLPEGSKVLARKLAKLQPRAVALHPPCLSFDEPSRPARLLEELARRDWVVIWCQPPPSNGSFLLQQSPSAPNVLLLWPCDYALPVIQHMPVLIYTPTAHHNLYSSLLPEALLWYDVFTTEELLLLSTNSHQQQLLKSAMLVTTSSPIFASQLSAYRSDLLVLVDGSSIDQVSPAVAVPAKHIGGSKDSLDAFSRGRSGSGWDGASAAARDGLPSATQLVLGFAGSIGRRTFNWEHYDACVAWAMRHNVQVRLVGSVEDDVELQQRLQLPAAGGTVQVVRAESRAVLQEHMSAFDIAFLPVELKAEGMAVVGATRVLELIAAGLPVATAPLPELLRHQAKRADELGGEAADGEAPSCLSLPRTVPEWIAALNAFLRHRCRTALPSKSQQTWMAQVERRLLPALAQRPSAWRLWGSLTSRNSVGFYTIQFMDMLGENFFAGGAERYALDLGELCEEHGLRMTVYQWGDSSWLRRFRGLNVVSVARAGLATPPSKARLDSASLLKLRTPLNRLYTQLAASREVLSIYSAFFEAVPTVAKPNIGISHGVAWDSPVSGVYGDRKKRSKFWPRTERYIDAVRLLDGLVSVDTNTVNWFQTISYADSLSMSVVTNYVDGAVFKPRPAFDQPLERVRIIYPRRLYNARGLDMLLECVDSIMAEFPNVDIHFVGRGFAKELSLVDAKVAQFPGRVLRLQRSPEEMPTVYAEADISLIPTRYSEGTSLSAIEAMACGNALIATRVGGLTDLVIDRYNGLLIDPIADELLHAIRRLLKDPDLLQQLKRNSLSMAGAFTKRTWREKWWRVISNTLRASPNYSPSIPPSPQPFYGLHLPVSALPACGGLVRELLLRRRAIVYVFLPLTRRQLVDRNLLSFERLQFIASDAVISDEPDIVAVHHTLMQPGTTTYNGKPVQFEILALGELVSVGGS